MGISLPKLPIKKLFSASAKSSASGLLFPSKKPGLKRTQIDIVPPEWLEPIEGYHIAWCCKRDNGRFGECVVVGYHPDNFSNSEDMGFVKIYVLDDNKDDSPPWMKKPFCRMKEIWKEIHVNKKINSVTYEMTEDGRVYGNTMGFPTDYNIGDAICDINSMYDLWKKFPNAPDWDTVGRLCEAQEAIDRLKTEEAHSWIANQIKEARETIKNEQERIAKLEKDLNKIYENSADAMNLFEEYGMEPNMEGDGEPEKDKSGTIDSILSDHDFGSLYPSSIRSMPITKFVGEASITTLPSGNVLVRFPSNQPDNLTKGDIVVGSVSGKRAIYCGNGSWASIG